MNKKENIESTNEVNDINEDEVVDISEEDKAEDASALNEESIEENSECEPEFKIRILENKLKEQEDAMLRLNAEYTNYRRRTADEKSTIELYAIEKLSNELIPVIDNLERALDACEDKESSLYVGVELVYTQMLDALSKSGLETIPAEIGSDFDHNLHMAVMQESSEEFEAGKITLVLQKGYKLGKKVLRATMVKVSC